ncbi:MAG: glycine cleavage system protein GcvH [Candidatus Latescibacteria bacterium]|nr:glycine cleavage system protein GcvH [Candidatus Latescibacterota bacterium]
MMYPEGLKYAKTHEWLKVEDNEGKVGITYYAQDRLGDITFVELPQVGAELTKGKSFGTVESFKAVSEFYAPVSGKVIQVNKELRDNPELINQDPYGQGWILVVEIASPAEMEELLSPSDYEQWVKQQEEVG